MEYIVGESREQAVLFAERLDDLISPDNPVRFIDGYVNQLNLRELNFKIKGGKTGRPAYSTKDVLKLYIYGYMNRIRSSRRLEDECKRNIELMWLMRRLAPDFKTIADFRKDNKKGIKQVYKEFLKFCYGHNLLSFEIVGIDGTKMRAQNSNNNIYKREEMEKIEKQIDSKMEEYLSELAKNDISEKGEYDSLKKNIETKLEKLKTKKEKLEKVKEIFEKNPETTRYFGNDPECELMRDKGCVRPAYNVQAAVDDKHKLIVAIDVVNESNDCHQIVNMSDKVEEIKREIGFDENVDTAKVADAGYYSENEIMTAKDRGHNTYVANPEDESEKRGGGKKDEIPSEGYKFENFKYSAAENVYICPEGKKLKKKSEHLDKSNGKLTFRYVCRSCQGCDKKSLCTKSPEGRSISVYARRSEADEYKKKIRSATGKRLLERRKEICEHPFGTIKRHLGYDHFLLKGKDGALTEFSMISMAYNLKRVLNILGIQKLLASI